MSSKKFYVIVWLMLFAAAAGILVYTWKHDVPKPFRTLYGQQEDRVWTDLTAYPMHHVTASGQLMVVDPDDPYILIHDVQMCTDQLTFEIAANTGITKIAVYFDTGAGLNEQQKRLVDIGEAGSYEVKLPGKVEQLRIDFEGMDRMEQLELRSLTLHNSIREMAGRLARFAVIHLVLLIFSLCVLTVRRRRNLIGDGSMVIRTLFICLIQYKLSQIYCHLNAAQAVVMMLFDLVMILYIASVREERR